MARARYEDAVWESVPREAGEPAGLALRRRFLFEQLDALVAGEQGAHAVRVLDVGCGEGRLAAELHGRGAEVVALDVSAEALRRARERHRGLDLRLIAEPHRWPVADARFDLVWAGETIEHVLDTAGWFSEARRALRPGGRVALSTPAHGRLSMLALALRSRAFERHFDPRSDHLRFYSPRSLARLLSDFRFDDVSVRAAGGLRGARQTLLACARRARF